ncbi:phosphoribosylaminoimidazolesuccinocarboxamide synthase [Deltaproteobacteria bacterium TL4]
MLLEGKTKRLVPGPVAGSVVLETKDELTAGDAAKKATIEGLAHHKTVQCANVFSLLQAQGIPTAFIEQHSDCALLCYDCDMLPLELVTRRYAWGSVLKREPQLIQKDGAPFRFKDLRCEFYHKWAVIMPPLTEVPIQMQEGKARALYLKDGIWASGIYTDPYVHIKQGQWSLHSPKIPLEASKPLMTIDPVCDEKERNYILKELMIPCFETLEKAWQKVNTEFGKVALADIKIEVGRRKKDGVLVIADVIDNDSWRIWPGADPKRQLDKQNFRDGHPLSVVSDNYALVAELTREFLI